MLRKTLCSVRALFTPPRWLQILCVCALKRLISSRAVMVVVLLFNLSVRYLTNLATTPTEPKFKKIRVGNKAFQASRHQLDMLLYCHDDTGARGVGAWRTRVHRSGWIRHFHWSVNLRLNASDAHCTWRWQRRARTPSSITTAMLTWSDCSWHLRY